MNRASRRVMSAWACVFLLTLTATTVGADSAPLELRLSPSGPLEIGADPTRVAFELRARCADLPQETTLGLGASSTADWALVNVAPALIKIDRSTCSTEWGTWNGTLYVATRGAPGVGELASVTLMANATSDATLAATVGLVVTPRFAGSFSLSAVQNASSVGAPFLVVNTTPHSAANGLFRLYNEGNGGERISFSQQNASGDLLLILPPPILLPRAQGRSTVRFVNVSIQPQGSASQTAAFDLVARATSIVNETEAGETHTIRVTVNVHAQESTPAPNGLLLAIAVALGCALFGRRH